MLGEGLPLAIQDRFVSKDSLTVRLLLEETISGGSVKGNKKVILDYSTRLKSLQNEIFTI